MGNGIITACYRNTGKSEGIDDIHESTLSPKGRIVKKVDHQSRTIHTKSVEIESGFSSSDSL